MSMLGIRLKRRVRQRPRPVQKERESQARRATVYVTRDGRGRVISSR
jgi:hypothetical protein